MQDESLSERRGGARFALKLAASLRLPGQPRVPARLLDLSREGCRLLINRPVSKGTSFWLTISGLEPQFCQVMWAHSPFVGVRFALSVADALFEQIVTEHGSLTERDSAELKTLSRQCAELAQAAQENEDAPQLISLARDCASEASAFEELAHLKRMEALNARTQQILSRLSVRPQELS